MRIGLISPPWVPVPPPAYGGIEAVVDELARGLVAEGHEVLMVMIEALARGTPAVATPCGSVPELIDDGVTGFVRSSPEELADTLHQVPTLDRGRCRTTAAERFSSARMVADHLALYEQILAGRHPRLVA